MNEAEAYLTVDRHPTTKRESVQDDIRGTGLWRLATTCDVEPDHYCRRSAAHETSMYNATGHHHVQTNIKRKRPISFQIFIRVLLKELLPSIVQTLGQNATQFHRTVIASPPESKNINASQKGYHRASNQSSQIKKLIVVAMTAAPILMSIIAPHSAQPEREGRG